jgi:hypothetical protein
MRMHHQVTKMFGEHKQQISDVVRHALTRLPDKDKFTYDFVFGAMKTDRTFGISYLLDFRKTPRAKQGAAAAIAPPAVPMYERVALTHYLQESYSDDDARRGDNAHSSESGLQLAASHSANQTLTFVLALHGRLDLLPRFLDNIVRAAHLKASKAPSVQLVIALFPRAVNKDDARSAQASADETDIAALLSKYEHNHGLPYA